MLKDLLELQIELAHIFGTELRYWKQLMISSASVGVAMWTFMQEQIWTTPQLMIIIIILTVFDFLTGIGLAAKKNQVETRKARRLLYTLGALIGILIVAHQCAKADPFWLGWMPMAFFMPMLLIQLASVIKNLSLLGYLPTKIANALYARIDAYKNPTDKPDGTQ